jgi:hypothetical protein
MGVGTANTQVNRYQVPYSIIQPLNQRFVCNESYMDYQPDGRSSVNGQYMTLTGFHTGKVKKSSARKTHHSLPALD